MVLLLVSTLAPTESDQFSSTARDGAESGRVKLGTIQGCYFWLLFFFFLKDAMFAHSLIDFLISLSPFNL